MALINTKPAAKNHEITEQSRDVVLESLLDRHEKGLLNYLYRYLGSVHDAEDVAQHAFIKTYLNAKKCPSPEAMSRYLYRVAANAALNVIRRRRIIKMFSFSGLARSGDEDGFSAENLPDTAKKNPETAYNESLRSKLVRRALAALPHNQKTALMLSFYDGKSYEDIAAILGKSVGAVESLIFRARKNLTERLKEIEL